MMENITQEDKDLCKTCEHYWIDFLITPDKHYVPHCEKVDKKYGFKNIDDIIPYPCLKCPFDSYKKKT